MSQWQRVCQLMPSNDKFRQRVSELYGRTNIPVKIRSLHANWIEQQDWMIDVTTGEGAQLSQCLFNQLSSLIQLSVEQLRNSKPCESIMDFEVSVLKLQKSFETSCGSFVQVIRHCLEEERALIREFSNNSNSETVPEGNNSREERASENTELIRDLQAIRQTIDVAAGQIDDIEKKQEAFLADYKQKLSVVTVLEAADGYKGLSRDQCVAESQKIRKYMEHLALVNRQSRDNMALAEKNIAIKLAGLIKKIWDDVDEWRNRERKQMTGLTKTLEGALDILDNLCNIGGELLHRLIGQIERCIGLCNKFFYQDDVMKGELETILSQLKNEYLPVYLKKAFVIEQNIPERILKISGKKSATFSMSVRLLGGASLGLEFSKPMVRMSVFYENDLPREEVYKAGEYGLDNGGEKPFIVNKSAVANFHAMRITKFRRPNPPRHLSGAGAGAGASAGGSSEELVTEQKYAIVFYTVINICQLQLPIRVVSEPVIFISQTSQEIMAKGTLIWDSAFSDIGRFPYKYRERVPWVEVAAVLNALFRTHTDRELDEHQMRYLAKVVFHPASNEVSDFGAYQISEKQVIKDKLEKKDFSFWKWFWACMNLTKEFIRQEWKDGLIYGFISKEDAHDKLLDMECGTFLLRFSEGSIESCQKANVCGYLTVAVVEKDPDTGQKKLFHVRDYMESKEIQSKKGLGVILDAMQVQDSVHPKQKKKLLKYLYPDTVTPFQQRFKIEAPNMTENDGYRSAKIIIEIDLGGGGAVQQQQNANETLMRGISRGSSRVDDTSSSTGYDVNSPALSYQSDDLSDITPTFIPSRPLSTVLPMINHTLNARSGLIVDGFNGLHGSSSNNAHIIPSIIDDIGDMDMDVANFTY